VFKKKSLPRQNRGFLLWETHKVDLFQSANYWGLSAKRSLSGDLWVWTNETQREACQM